MMLARLRWYRGRSVPASRATEVEGWVNPSRIVALYSTTQPETRPRVWIELTGAGDTRELAMSESEARAEINRALAQTWM